MGEDEEGDTDQVPLQQHGQNRREKNSRMPPSPDEGTRRLGAKVRQLGMCQSAMVRLTVRLMVRTLRRSPQNSGGGGMGWAEGQALGKKNPNK